MEKMIRTFEINHPLNWEWGIEIKKLREDLDAVEKLGATHINIEHGASYDCSYVEITAYAERLETDKECMDRIDRAIKHQEEIKRRELEQLEKLKSKYGI